MKYLRRQFTQRNSFISYYTAACRTSALRERAVL